MITLHTNYGDIKIQLNTEKAPVTAENFLQYCRDGFYNDTIFHRVIDGFMIQGGGMKPGMEEKTTRDCIDNEAKNGLKNKIGTLAMARTSDPHSASSQFFINVSDNTFLDFTAESQNGWGYCVFADVVEGMEVVNKIKSAKTGRSGNHQDVPVEDIHINNVTIG